MSRFAEILEKMRKISRGCVLPRFAGYVIIISAKPGREAEAIAYTRRHGSVTHG
jgi:hypothetical protein